MFKAKFKDAGIVKGIFESVSAIITETKLQITEDGISLTAMDLSHICLVHLNLKKEDMDFFETDKDYELAINLEDLVKIIKRSGSNDEITFIHDPKEKKLVIQMKPENAKKAREFTVSLIDLEEEEEINLESLEALGFANTFTMDIKFLDEAIKDAEIFSEVLQIEIKDDLIFSTTGNIGDMVYELEKEELEHHDFTEESIGIFAVSYLKNVLKISTIASKAEFGTKSEAPLKMIFDILNSSKIMYFLAPRVEEDDDAMYED